MVRHFQDALQGSPEFERLKDEAGTTLREIVAQQLAPLLAGFVDQTQNALKHPSSADHNAADIRKNAELARKLKQQTSEWTASLLRQVEERVFPATDNSASTDRAENERANASLIAMAKALLIAETKYFKRIAEVDARMNRVRLIVDLGIDTKALAPTGLHQALVATAEEMRWPREARKLLYNSFDTHVIGQLDALYDQLLASVRKIGQQAAQLVVESTFDLTHLEEEEQSGAQAGTRGWMSPPEGASQVPVDVDGKTQAMLTRMALQDEGEGYSDGLLAADLLALMDRRPLPGISCDDGDYSVQRTSLAGHFLNEVTNDPLVDKSKKAEHEPLRMPLVKSAIADSSVFTDASHPLANLIDDHLTRAARHRLQNVEEAQQIEDSLAEILSLFELAPDFVRESMVGVKPLQDDQIQRFYELQRKQAEQRREFVINEAKRLVAEEVERSCFARNVPAPATRFLEKAWSALLTQRLLKFGASDARWQDGIDKMDQLINLLEERDPTARPEAAWVDLIKALSDELVQGGLPAEQRSNIIKLLEAARKTRR